MALDDFAQVADPWLRKLENDPSRSLEQAVEPTTFPPGGGELAGQVSDTDRREGTLEGQVSIFVDSDAPTPGGGLGPSDEDVEAGRAAYREVGIDVLAFYKSFRFRSRPPFRDTWGIFLLDAGIAAVTAEYAEMAPALPSAEVRKVAIATLLAHERYHFWIDAWALGQEVLPLSPCIKRYEYYLAKKRHVSLTEHDIEESLANHYAFQQLRTRQLSDGSKAGRLVRALFKNCPVPYSQFSLAPRTRARREGRLAANVANGVIPDSELSQVVDAFVVDSAEIGVMSPGIRPAPPSHPVVSRHSCPVYHVQVTGYATRVQPFQGPPLRVFRQFIERYLAGVKEPRTDHDYYRIDNGEKVKFPNPHDKEVRGYELQGTLHKAGMTRREFIDAQTLTRFWKTNCPRNPPKPPLRA